MRVLLTIKTGSQAGRDVELQSGQAVRIGRSPEVELSFPEDAFMSGIHCTLECGVKICSIYDHGSTNGVSLNGAKVRSAEVKSGDEIVAGRTHILVQIDQTTASTILGDTQEPANLPPLLPADSQPLYAILDAAQDPEILAVLRKSGQPYESLYEGPRGEALASVAPYLVRVPEDSVLLKTLEQRAQAKSWGVFLTCDQQSKEIRKHLRRFLTVQLPDGSKVLFRYYDPRVLRVFLPSCTAEEAADFFGPVKDYWIEGEGPGKLLQFRLDGGVLVKRQMDSARV